MKKFVLGVLCGVGLGATACLASTIVVGLRLRALEPIEETVPNPDHH